MSIIGATNSGGGGNNISITSAMLQVFAPVGSIVTATKDGTTKTSKEDIIVNDRPTIGMHLISISNSQLGTWVITATRGEDSNTSSIIIDGVKEEYEVYISYHVPIDVYQEVEFLEATGSQYINPQLTGVNGIDIDFQFTTTSAIAAYGARNGWSNTNAFSMTNYSNKFWYLPIPSDSYSQYMPSIDTSKHNFQYGSNNGWKAEFDGVNWHTYSSMAVSSSQILLYAENVGGVQNKSKVKIYHVALYINGTLNRDMYPCYRVSDSTAGFYDKVNGVFYTNSGSGTFVVGADV